MYVRSNDDDFDDADDDAADVDDDKVVHRILVWNYIIFMNSISVYLSTS